MGNLLRVAAALLTLALAATSPAGAQAPTEQAVVTEVGVPTTIDGKISSGAYLGFKYPERPA